MKTIDQEIVSKFQSEQHRALVNLMFTANFLKRMHSEYMKPFDITTQQYNILRILNGSYPKRLPMQEIVKRMIEKSPNATRLANKLIDKGYVKRTQCTEDKRVIYLTATEKGIKFLYEVNLDFQKATKEIEHKLSSKDASLLNHLLDTIRN